MATIQITRSFNIILLTPKFTGKLGINIFKTPKTKAINSAIFTKHNAKITRPKANTKGIIIIIFSTPIIKLILVYISFFQTTKNFLRHKSY